MTIKGRPDSAVQPVSLRTFSPWLTQRWTITFAGIAIIAVGLFLNWKWLTAVGAAPILLSLAPCLAMCALGLCMRGGGTRTCQNQGNSRLRSRPPNVASRRSKEL